MELRNTITIDGQDYVYCLKHGHYETADERGAEIG